ncbi:glycosyltransferase family 39 protein [Pseudarthrobacter sp. MEB009]|uniref:glycosyltransferase family 39 protein n=1 Tax=Pseudarthrobacter sp. MEB009 TaxID=3040326 RepID=UPI0025546CDB|nr:glycosyltransferase family 39 protein [Pseudarthrobacter sp. MEB009]
METQNAGAKIAGRRRALTTERPWLAPVGIGLLAFCAAFVGSWVPSFWDDEIATISAAGRSPAELLLLLQSVDAVHGIYYFLMHLWTAVFGFSEVALRFPSALAVGAAAGLTVVLGRRLGSAPLGVAAGLVLALLPRMVWAGTESRQSALTTVLAVLLTLLLLRAWESNRPLDWVLYSLCAVVGVGVFMFFALAIVAHAVAAVILRRRIVATLAASAVAGVAALPFLVFALGQKAQVEWIQNRSLTEHLVTAVVKQYFYGDDRPTGNLPPQWVLAFMVVLGLLQGALVVRGVWAARLDAQLRQAMVLGLAGVLVPVGGLLLASLITQPVYVARYLTFTAPAFALLVGMGLISLPRRRVGFRFLVAGLVLCSLVPQLTLKSLVNEPPDTERRIAALVDQEPERPAAVVFGAPYLRDMVLAYPDDFAGIADLSLAASPATSGSLWGVDAPVAPDQLTGKGEVLFVGTGGGTPGDTSAFGAAGCRETGNQPFQRLVLISFDCP